MLINLKTKNFKSFKDGFDFTMRASLIRDLNYSVIRYKDKSKDLRILPTSVIYGPNSSGKTSLIDAFLVIKTILINGNINNPKFHDKSILPYEFITSINSEENEPVEFEICFEVGGNIYEYNLSTIFGEFGSINTERKIISEKLFLNNEEIYVRDESNVSINIKNIPSHFLNPKFNTKNFYSNIEMINANLDKSLLFLSTDFPSFISKDIFSIIKYWFSEELCVFKDFQNVTFGVVDDKKDIVPMPKDLYNAASKIGVIGSNMLFNKKENDDHTTLFSYFENKNNAIAVQSDVIESLGTIKFIDLFPVILIALKKGQVLIIDEMDNSLHPSVVAALINIFHNPELNTKKAQLIFNTHNPIFLDNNIFRRDEMCFVEKDRETKNSEIYKLSDFGTNSNNPIRNTTDYISNYFKNKYGAIEYVDFTDEISSFLNRDDNSEVVDCE